MRDFLQGEVFLNNRQYTRDEEYFIIISNNDLNDRSFDVIVAECYDTGEISDRTVRIDRFLKKTSRGSLAPIILDSKYGLMAYCDKIKVISKSDLTFPTATPCGLVTEGVLQSILNTVILNFERK